MAHKGNQSTPATITEAVLQQHMHSAFDCFTQAKDRAGEAAGHAYLLYRDTRMGDPKKWLEDEFAVYKVHADKHNADLKARFDRADEFMRNGLKAEEDINQKPRDEAHKLAQEEERVTLRKDAAMEESERRKLRYVSLEARTGVTEFNPLVKWLFRFHHSDQSSQVTRYCLALEWIKGKFPDETHLDINQIKVAFSANKGFDACIEEQSLKRSPDNNKFESELKRDEIDKRAREKLKAEPSKGNIPMTILKPKDGFGLVLVYTNGATIDVLGDAGAPDVDILRAVKYLGSDVKIDTDPATEFMGRMVQIADLITEGAEVDLDDGRGGKIPTQRMITMRPDSLGNQQLVASLTNAESGPVLHARPRDTHIMALPVGAAVLQLDERRKLERQIRDRGERSLITIKANLNPVTGAGKTAASAMSWACENSAFVDVANVKSISQVYWTHFSNIANRPMDVDNFQPEFEGTLDASDLQLIHALIPKPRAVSKSKTKKTETKDDGTTKVPRTVLFEVDGSKLKVTAGDADPLELGFVTDSAERVKVRLRAQDLYATLTCLQELDCQSLRLSGEDGGLVKLSWEDGFGFYQLHHPTCGTDGKLHSRRVNTLRVKTPAAVAAE